MLRTFQDTERERDGEKRDTRNQRQTSAKQLIHSFSVWGFGRKMKYLNEKTFNVFQLFPPNFTKFCIWKFDSILTFEQLKQFLAIFIFWMPKHISHGPRNWFKNISLENQKPWKWLHSPFSCFLPLSILCSISFWQIQCSFWFRLITNRFDNR